MEEQSGESGIYSQVGDRTDVQNAELFVLTYGSVVAQLCKDTDDANEVNKPKPNRAFLQRPATLNRSIGRRGAASALFSYSCL